MSCSDIIHSIIEIIVYLLHHILVIAQGDISTAMERYSSALNSITLKKQTDETRHMSAILLSNRAMCQLKNYQSPTKAEHDDVKRDLLEICIRDCTDGLQHLESQSRAVSSEQIHSTKSKLLYRRARAFFLSTDSQMSREESESKLNSAAKDLLSIMSFDQSNKEVAQLLRSIKKKYGVLGGDRSRVARALDYLRDPSSIEEDANITPINCLRTMQASLADDPYFCSEEIGRNGGVSLLMSIARRIITCEDLEEQLQCRIASLQILSACCSHDVFIMNYALRDQLSPATLAQIAEEECKNYGSSDLVIATMALLIRLIVHYDHWQVMRFFATKIEEDGTIKDNSTAMPHVPEVDGSSICRVSIAALSWRSKAGDTSTPTSRAALDLLSTWTASDLDALDAASDACFNSYPSLPLSRSNIRKAADAKLTPEEIRKMKPRQMAVHRKREAEYRTANLHRALNHIKMFCNRETGGLDTMLTLCATTLDHRLRREVGMHVGRMMSLFEENDDVKKLVAHALGCSNWRVNDNMDVNNIDTLTIEELGDEEEKYFEGERGSEQELLSIMKQGQMTASLLLGKPDIGTWALKSGWSNGKGVELLKHLIASGDCQAMSIISELLSEAASVESARPLLAPLVEQGTLNDLLAHPDADVRSGAASCVAKIGLASTALSQDEAEVIELLGVAIELLFEEDELDSSNSRSNSPSKVVSSKLPAAATSVERGVEVICYLAQKTFVKNSIASGYKPKESSSNRKAALQQLVEIACSSCSSDAQMAYGLACIFNLIAVSIETLQKEAFAGKEITKEQYDQLQALGKTDEEKEMEAKKAYQDGDNLEAVTDRIHKMANANVPRAMVKLLEGSNTDSTQQKVLEGIGRMACEPSVRGMMIQQGCLSACLQLDKGVSGNILINTTKIFFVSIHSYTLPLQEKPNESEKSLLRHARSCIAKLLISTNPGVLTVSHRTGSIGPLIKLVQDNEASDLMHFEALLSLTNLAGYGNETKNRVAAQNGISVISYAMFSDHEMVRQAATEALCNMVGHDEMSKYLQKEDNLKIWVAFACDYEENYACARASVGGLAMAVPNRDVANAMIKAEKFCEMIRTLSECGHLELMHRVLVLITGLLEHGGQCKAAVLTSGVGAFCEAYVASYHDGTKQNDLNFSPSQQGAFTATLSLAKEVIKMLD